DGHLEAAGGAVITLVIDGPGYGMGAETQLIDHIIVSEGYNDSACRGQAVCGDFTTCIRCHRFVDTDIGIAVPEVRANRHVTRAGQYRWLYIRQLNRLGVGYMLLGTVVVCGPSADDLLSRSAVIDHLVFVPGPDIAARMRTKLKPSQGRMTGYVRA